MDGWSTARCVPVMGFSVFAGGSLKLTDLVDMKGKEQSGAELTSFASSLLESCATTSGLERFFSTCKWFQGALRNSLGVEKVKMLCVCNRELRSQDMEDEDGW